jgi:hypothetical protein
MKLGICGEHGGDPASIHFCESVGLDYVSCSPYPRADRASGGGAGGAESLDLNRRVSHCGIKPGPPFHLKERALALFQTWRICIDPGFIQAHHYSRVSNQVR